MTSYLGDEYRLYVGDGATPTEVFAVVKGQTDMTIDDSTDLIDTSSKSTGRIRTQRPGRRGLQISVNGKLELPDATGLEECYALAIADPSLPANFQVRKTPFATGDVVLEGSFYVSGFNRAMPDADNATWSFTLTAAATPTIDLLDI